MVDSQYSNVLVNNQWLIVGYHGKWSIVYGWSLLLEKIIWSTFLRHYGCIPTECNSAKRHHCKCIIQINAWECPFAASLVLYIYKKTIFICPNVCQQNLCVMAMVLPVFGIKGWVMRIGMPPALVVCCHNFVQTTYQIGSLQMYYPNNAWEFDDNFFFCNIF